MFGLSGRVRTGVPVSNTRAVLDVSRNTVWVVGDACGVRGVFSDEDVAYTFLQTRGGNRAGGWYIEKWMVS